MLGWINFAATIRRICPQSRLPDLPRLQLLPCDYPAVNLASRLKYSHHASADLPHPEMSLAHDRQLNLVATHAHNSMRPTL